MLYPLSYGRFAAAYKKGSLRIWGIFSRLTVALKTIALRETIKRLYPDQELDTVVLLDQRTGCWPAQGGGRVRG